MEPTYITFRNINEDRWANTTGGNQRKGLSTQQGDIAPKQTDSIAIRQQLLKIYPGIRKLFNGSLLVLAKIIKNIMSSAAESEVGDLYMNAREDVPIRTTLIEMGHPQPAAPLTTDNNTAKGILNGTLKQKRSKSINMRFNWLKYRVARKQFTVRWEPGKYNLADYP